MKRLLAISFIGMALSAAVAYAHSNATGIVKERMDMMVQLRNDTRALARMARGTQDVDWSLVEAAGQHAKQTGERLPLQFPDDSFKAPSEAKKAILENPEDFKALADELLAAGDALIQASATQNQEALKTAFQAFGQTCKACHSEYRQ